MSEDTNELLNLNYLDHPGQTGFQPAVLQGGIGYDPLPDFGSQPHPPECGYDGGDCCEGTCDDDFAFYTCDDDFAFYTCGANQPYECLSEDR